MYTRVPMNLYPWTPRPYTNITPFTVRDGATYLQILEGLRHWLRAEVIPHIDENFSELVVSWENNIEELTAAVDAQLDANVDLIDSKISDFNSEITNKINSFIDDISDQLSNQNILVDSKINDFEDYVNNKVNQIINSSIEVQDPVVAGLIGQESDTSSALDYRVADKNFLTEPGTYLDIWPEIDNLPDNYNDWISSIDNDLSGYVTKERIGADSTGSDIHMFTYGTGSKHILITTGQHPWEFLGQVASRQFFVQFVTSKHPSMAALRNKVTIHFIPAVIPGMFRDGRENRNGVNINRNYDFNWYVSDHPLKGAYPFSEPETVVIRSVIDDNPISLVIDCHNYGSEGQSTIGYGTASPLTLTKDSVFNEVIRNWEVANGDLPDHELLASNTRQPTINSWAQKYMRFDKGRRDSFSLLIECLSTLANSDDNKVTRKANRWYCSFIYQGILTWLKNGMRDDLYKSISKGNHSLTSGGYDVPISQGGRMIEGHDWQALQFEYTSTVQGIDVVEFAFRYPGRINFIVSANLSSRGASADNYTRFDMGVNFYNRFDPNSVKPTSPIESSIRTVDINTPDGRGFITLNYVTNVIKEFPNNTIYAGMLFFRVNNKGNIMSNNSVSDSGGGCTMQIEVIPEFEEYVGFGTGL